MRDPFLPSGSSPNVALFHVFYALLRNYSSTNPGFEVDFHLWQAIAEPQVIILLFRARGFLRKPGFEKKPDLLQTCFLPVDRYRYVQKLQAC